MTKNIEREKLEDDLLEVVGMLPFLERGHTLNPKMYPSLVDFILADRARIAAETEQRVRGEAEDAVIAIAHKHCARCDGLVTPVRSVSGGVTFYCQKCDVSRVQAKRPTTQQSNNPEPKQ